MNRYRYSLKFQASSRGLGTYPENKEGGGDDYYANVDLFYLDPDFGDFKK